MSMGLYKQDASKAWWKGQGINKVIDVQVTLSI